LSGFLQLLGEALQLHQLLEALVYSEAEVLTNQGKVDVFLVDLDYGIQNWLGMITVW
jgi:hypothetical protein